MNKKHTSGPWSFSTPSGGVFADKKLVASVYGDDPECKPDDRLRANARLIAAAPEMLDVLYKVFGFIASYEDVVDGPDGRPQANPAMRLALEIRTAIAKATVGNP